MARTPSIRSPALREKESREVVDEWSFFLQSGKVFVAVQNIVEYIFTMSGGLFALMNKKGREERRMKELREAFDAADKDGDGKLNPEEWLSVLKVTGVEANW